MGCYKLSHFFLKLRYTSHTIKHTFGVHWNFTNAQSSISMAIFKIWKNRITSKNVPILVDNEHHLPPPCSRCPSHPLTLFRSEHPSLGPAKPPSDQAPLLHRDHSAPAWAATTWPSMPSCPPAPCPSLRHQPTWDLPHPRQALKSHSSKMTCSLRHVPHPVWTLTLLSST